MGRRRRSASPGKNLRNIIGSGSEKLTVIELVYKYLSNAEYVDSKRKQRNNACAKFREKNARTKSVRGSDIIPRTRNIGAINNKKLLNRRQPDKDKNQLSVDILKIIRKGSKYAKSFVRGALSFGVDAGYLIPGDPTRKVFYLSPSLKLHNRNYANE